MIADPVFADLLQGNDEDSADGAEYGHGHGYGHHHDHDHDHSATHGGVGTDVPKASGMNGHLQDPSRHNLDNTNSKSPSPPASQATSHSHSHANPHLHSNAQPEPHSHSHSHSHPDPSSSSRSASSPTTQADRDQAQDKIRSTLRSFVRDWSVEGEPERNATYVPCLEALERFFPRSGSRDRRDVRVLVPGCGLGRLAMEVAARGGWFLPCPCPHVFIRNAVASGIHSGSQRCQLRGQASHHKRTSLARTCSSPRTSS